jgi:hypothetical protein
MTWNDMKGIGRGWNCANVQNLKGRKQVKYHVRRKWFQNDISRAWSRCVNCSTATSQRQATRQNSVFICLEVPASVMLYFTNPLHSHGRFHGTSKWMKLEWSCYLEVKRAHPPYSCSFFLCNEPPSIFSPLTTYCYGIALFLLACTWEVLNLNREGGTGNCVWRSRWFPQSAQKISDTPPLDHFTFLPNCWQFIIPLSSFNSTQRKFYIGKPDVTHFLKFGNTLKILYTFAVIEYCPPCLSGSVWA